MKLNTQAETKLQILLANAHKNTFRCRQCGLGFESVKYIDGKTRGVSPCCDGWFDYVKLSERQVKKIKTSKVEKLQQRLASRGIELSIEAVAVLRKCELVLHNWHEWECGLDNGHASYCIVRDDVTGKPFVEHHPYNGKSYRTPCTDREAGALKRIALVCKENNIHYYIQTDPRGCALYISKEPMTDSNYSSLGYAVCD